MTSRDPNGRYSSYPTRSQRIKFNKNKIEIKLSILLNSLAQIYGNGYKDINEKTVVSIKPLPLVWPKASNLSRFLIKLGDSERFLCFFDKIHSHVLIFS